MLLIIPVIDLLGSHCVRPTEGSFRREKTFFEDPIKMAKLWRIQNARALHVHGHDEGNTCQRKVLRSLCEAVDIPIQLHGGFANLEDVKSAFDAGIYRVVIDIASEELRALFSDALHEFGPGKTAAGIHASEGVLTSDSETRAIELCKDLEHEGCRRIFYTDVDGNGELTDENLEAFRLLGTELRKTRITAAGGISGFKQLMQFEEMREMGIDSVVIGRALYENRFPCQQFWCWNYKNEVDLGRFSTAQLSGS